jgi:hypothetical protein
MKQQSDVCAQSIRAALSLTLMAVLALGICQSASAQTFMPIKPPSVPLITREPYMNTWLENTTAVAPGTWPHYWDGSTKAITGIAYIDSKAYLFSVAPVSVPITMTQTALQITPAQSTKP